MEFCKKKKKNLFLIFLLCLSLSLCGFLRIIHLSLSPP